MENIAKALLNAQKKMGGVKKSSTNPFFKSKYADLASVLDACKDALNSEGITILQPVRRDENGQAMVQTMLLHVSGELLEATMPVMPAPDMQKLGASITYARRQSLQSFLALPAEDDDGETAVGRGQGTYKVKPLNDPKELEGNGVTTPSGYRIPAGSFAQKSLEEVGKEKLGKYLKDMEARLKTTGVKLKDANPWEGFQEFYERANKFIGVKSEFEQTPVALNNT